MVDISKPKVINYKIERVSMGTARPFYDLRVVREAIRDGRAFVAHREKNLETLDALGYTDEDAIRMVAQLRINDFKGIAWERGRAADEYLKRIEGKMIYIKFFMENELVVLSFHD